VSFHPNKQENPYFPILFSQFFVEISIVYPLFELIPSANRLYAKQENMNFTLTLLDNVTKVCEKRNIVYH